MEENLKEISLMEEEEFKEYLRNNKVITLEALSKFHSLGRAIRRGLVDPSGMINPKRPFNNRANTSKRKGVHSRKNNELKKEIYGQFKQYQERHSF